MRGRDGRWGGGADNEPGVVGGWVEVGHRPARFSEGEVSGMRGGWVDDGCHLGVILAEDWLVNHERLVEPQPSRED